MRHAPADLVAKIRKRRDRADKLRRRWLAAERRYAVLAARADASDAVGTRIRGHVTATREAELAGQPKTERERRDAERLTRLQNSADLVKISDLKAANLAPDIRTAAGMRDLEVQNLGGTKRARSLTYRAMLGKRWNDVREEVCRRFDSMWHAASAGHFPPPKFEPGVDGGKLSSGLPNGGTNWDITALERDIGPNDVARLKERIIDGLDFNALARTGGYDARTRATLFIAAVDAAARAWGIRHSEPERRSA
jgi:hypothetical protein